MYSAEKIRKELKKNRIKQYELAKQAGIGEFSLCRWLRPGELTDDRAKILKGALNELIYAKEKQRGNNHHERTKQSKVSEIFTKR